MTLTSQDECGLLQPVDYIIKGICIAELNGGLNSPQKAQL
jgi:hypothetical protein